jgi:hypothetical protein
LREARPRLPHISERDHYDHDFKLKLTAEQKRDLIESLKSL